MGIHTLFYKTLHTSTAILGIGANGSDALRSMNMQYFTPVEECEGAKIFHGTKQLILLFDAEDGEAGQIANQHAIDAKKTSCGNIFEVAVTTSKKILDSAECPQSCFDQVIVTDQDLLHRPSEMLLFDMADKGFVGLDEEDVFALQKTAPQMMYFQNSCRDNYELNKTLKTLVEEISVLAGRKNIMCLVQCNAADMCLELLEDVEDALSAQNDVALWQMKENNDPIDCQITISLLVGERVSNDTPLA